MKPVLIYAGTTEGRVLSQRLAEKGVPCEVCVATEYGSRVMQEAEKKENLTVRQGRLLPEEMRSMTMAGEYAAVVDCTHPYATLVTENIKKSLEGLEVPYFRVLRKTKEHEDACQYFDSAEEAAKSLVAGSGKILLTTGSKELECFCKDASLRERLVVRVLPGRESLELCLQNGLEGKQIIAMQGPFTKDMNLAILRQYEITGLVTKESGKAGGMDEKLLAAKEAGIPCYVIRRPNTEAGESGRTLSEVYREVLSLEGVSLADEPCCALDVVLAGIGMGKEESRSVALERRLMETDYLFGAERMIQGLPAKKGSFAYYLEKDIVPCLEGLQREHLEDLKITILFSGDPGFFSGAQKLYEALRGKAGMSVRILPGISTVSALSAKLGISWQDAMIVSTHGTKKENWKAEMLFGMRRGRKIFFLTSGAEDIREIAQLLMEQGFQEVYDMCLGYQLSYENEKVWECCASDALKVSEKGLYAGFLVPKNIKSSANGSAAYAAPGNGQIVPGWRDEAFERGDVPMTKEEVRTISISKLALTEKAVVYDIGSGTGSVAMEIAALSPQIAVYAIECKQEAVSLIQKNKERLGASMVQVVNGMAPEALAGLPAPTHAFIGGSRGNLPEILNALYQKNPTMRIVMNAISLESIAQMQELVKKYPVGDLDVTTVSVSKAKRVGNYHLMQAANPVTIFSFTFREKEKPTVEEYFNGEGAILA